MVTSGCGEYAGVHAAWRHKRTYLAGRPNALSTLTLADLIAFNNAHAAQELQHFDQSIFLKAQAIEDSREEYQKKRADTRRAMREDGLDRLFAEHRLDALIGITEGPAWMIDRVNGDASFGPGMAGPPAVAGNPHITLPLARVADLPLGISLVGERWRDHRLASIAALLERAHSAPLVSAAEAPSLHDPWSALLQGCVATTPDQHSTAADYRCFADRHGQLEAYLDQLASVSAGEFANWDKARQLAFLINAYNAWTVELILGAWPDVESIRDLGSLLRSPWKKSFIPLLGETVSLDDIEHGMIREPGRYDDPRIHFAVNCASVGCPALRREAYRASLLEGQLEEQTRSFLSDPSRNRLREGRLELSSIFEWYGEDFRGGWRGSDSLGGFLARYADALALSDTQRSRLASGDLSIEFLDYDWRLNSPDNSR